MGSKPVGSFYVQLGLNTENFRRNLEYAQRDLRAAFGTAAIHASEVLAASIGAIGAAMTALGVKAVKMAADMEKQTVALTRLLGSAEKATKKIVELQKLASKSGFDIEELLGYQKRLMAVGFNEGETKYLLHNIAEINGALGFTGVEIDRLIKAFGDVKAKGTIQTQEMKQFAEAGLPVWDMLSEAMGKSRQELVKMVEARQISASQFLNAINDQIVKKYGGMMVEQSKTVTGAWIRMTNSVKIAMIDLGNWLTTNLPIKEAVNAIANFIDNVKAALNERGIWDRLNDLREQFPLITDTIQTLATNMLSLLIPALSSVGSFLMMMLAPLAGIYIKMLALGLIIKDVLKGLKDGKSIVLSLFEAMFAGLEVIWTDARRFYAQWWNSGFDRVSEFIAFVYNRSVWLKNSINTFATSLETSFQNLLDNLESKLDDFIIDIIDKFLELDNKLSIISDETIDKVFGKGTANSLKPEKAAAQMLKTFLSMTSSSAKARIDNRNKNLVNLINATDKTQTISKEDVKKWGTNSSLNPIKLTNAIADKITMAAVKGLFSLGVNVPDGITIPHLINDDPEAETKRLAEKTRKAEEKLAEAVRSLKESYNEYRDQIIEETGKLGNFKEEFKKLFTKTKDVWEDFKTKFGQGNKETFGNDAGTTKQAKEKALRENFGEIGTEAGNPLTTLIGFGYQQGTSLMEKFEKDYGEAYKKFNEMRKSVFDLRVEIASGLTDAFVTAMSASGNFFHNLGEGFKKLGDQILKQIAQMLIFSTILRALGINYSVSGFNVSPIFSEKPISGGVGDGIVSDGKIITTHPDDYIIATKDPSNLGGKANVVVNVNNNSSSEVSTNSYFDGTRTIVDIVIDGLQRNVNGLRDTVRAI